MDLTKLGRTEQVLSASGLLLFIFSFLPWFSASVSFDGESASGHANAWSDPSGFNDWFPILLLLIYGVVLALPAFGVAVPAQILLKFIELTGVDPLWLMRGEGMKYRKVRPRSEQDSNSPAAPLSRRTGPEELKP